eukprot:Skav214882  [mRNA]  locus=scaffold1430:168465:179881:- [translate_table: standard]
MRSSCECLVILARHLESTVRKASQGNSESASLPRTVTKMSSLLTSPTAEQNILRGGSRAVTKMSSFLTNPSAGQNILRGVSLRKTLSQAMSFWLRNPHSRSTAEKDRLYAASVQTKRLDIFLSHTWKTAGGWKFLSLLLQFGWPILWASWGSMVVIAFILCMGDVLPLFNTWEAHALGFDGLIPSGCWIQVFGLIGILGGCLLFPHLPFSKSDTCFLDCSCIHQTDQRKMQQGIMSISAFLAASDELRVLWSPPLLSRLWCVFELAAYRKVNPEGRVVIAPLGNESSACMMFLWWQVSSAAFWVARSGPGGGNPTSLLLVLVAIFSALIPATAFAIWRNHQNSVQLRSQLANFDVMNVDCSDDFDRECIHDAIIEWYGSLEAFSEHVQGPFSQEVLNLMRVGGSLSSHYIVLPLCPVLATALDNVLALCKAGAPAQAVISVFFNQVVALELLFFPSIGVFFTWICRKGLWLGKWRCRPLALEIAIILVLSISFAIVGTLVSVVIASRSLMATLLWNGFACLFAGLMWRCCWRSG